MPRSIAFIVNPQARGGKLRHAWPGMFSTLRKSLTTFDECSALLSERKGDCRALAKEASLTGASHVIAVGGDGTLNEVLNGLADSGLCSDLTALSGPVLGLLPFGTGGDFRTAIQMPVEMNEVADVFQLGAIRNIDAGMVEFVSSEGQLEKRMFLNVASCGISAEVSKLVNCAWFRIGSRLPYFIATLKALLRYRNASLRITFDEQETILLNDVKTVAIANGPRFGGNMKIAPDAKMNDGRFEVVAITDPGFFTALKHLRHLYDGTLKSLPEVSTWRASSVHIECLQGTGDVAIELDGETPGRLPATFRIHPGAVRIVVPGGLPE